VAEVLVDTDIFIDHLRGAIELKVDRHRLHYSVITRAELVAGTTATDLVATLLAPFHEPASTRLTRTSARRPSSIYPTGRRLGWVPNIGPDDVAGRSPVPSRWTIAIVGSPNPVPSTAVKMIPVPSGVHVGWVARV
jgi:hypothetical protein